jgi:ferredoxin
MLQILLFVVVLGATAYFAWRGYSRVWRNIHLGQPEKAGDRPAERWRNVLLVALGQQKMFKKPIPAILHLFLYVAFVITQIELLEILVDGLFGQHRFFAPLGAFYTFVISFIEILSVLALAGTIAFLYRRNAQRVPRLRPERHGELRGWPVRDANLILLAETVLIVAIFSMNGADKVLQARGVEHYPQTGAFAISGWLGPALFGGLDNGALIAIERIGWWLHILVVFGFLVYLPYSKHLHILLAFPNTYFARLRPQGEMLNMPEIQTEVRTMLGLSPLPQEANSAAAVTGVPDDPGAAPALPDFGANDVFSLSWVNVLHAYSCTECGRCTAVCPANITGKKLSPRKIVMDVRDRAEEIGRNLASGKYTRENYDDGKSLFDYISREELHACTTCQACVEACPVLIHPLEVILKMRRYEILTESAGPAEWLPLFNAIENNGAAWAMAQDRDAWTRG